MAVVATYAVLACSSLPPRSVEELAADTAIAAKVEAALVADPDIYARHIDVAVNRGVVRLGEFVYLKAHLVERSSLPILRKFARRFIAF
jgi:osmotically-inducible protein OsmY